MTDRTEYDSYVARHATFNFWVNVIDLAFYAMAGSLIYGSTVMTLYASYLTDSKLLIGLIPAIQNAGYYVPQLIWAQRTEHLPRKKPLMMRVSVVERVGYLAIALGILLWPGAPRWLAYSVLLLSLAAGTSAGGLVAPAWHNLIAKVIPVDRRGRLFGLGQALGGLFGLAGAALSRHLLTAHGYPLSFGLCFMASFVAQALSWTSLSLNREAAQASEREPLSTREYLRRLPAILQRNRNYARYLLARALVTLGSMANTFYVLFARQEYAITDAFAAELTMVALASQMLSNPLLGWVADRTGWKLLTELCTLLGLAAVLVALFAPGAGWLYLVFALMNISISGTSLASMGMPMEFAGEDDLPTLVALTNSLLAAPVLLAPVLGGWLVDGAGYRGLFWVAIALLVAGWGTLRWAVREPRQARAVEHASRV
ncbi:MAG: MFS transporter [Chloroflexi bacterium]|nr:MFS transporter [Chloroflexota bacterium]